MDSSNDKFIDDNWWTGRSSLEKKLLILSLILVVMSVLVITFVAILHSEHNSLLFYIQEREDIINANAFRLEVSSTPPKPNKVVGSNRMLWSELCLTPACIETAYIFLSNMDQSVSPCDDFYRFSCGKWLNNSVIPDNRLSVSTTGIIVETMEMQFRELIEEPSKPSDPVFFKNIKHIYSSCMNLSQLELLDDQPLLAALYELGGWPVAEGTLWNESNFDWIDLSLKLRQMGLPFNEFFHMSVGLDIKDSTKHIITVSVESIAPIVVIIVSTDWRGIAGRRLKKAMLNGLNDPNVRAYFDLLVHSAGLLRANQFNPNLFNELMQLISFQTRVANLTTPLEETRDLNKLYHKMTVEDLQRLAPNTNWVRLLTGIFGRPISKAEELVVHNPSYVQQIDLMIKQSSKRLLANHMMTDVILTAMPLLGPKWLHLYDLYLHRVTGRRAVPPRWQICIKSAAALSTAFSALYVRKYFKEESKRKAEEMVDFIHHEFVKMLNGVDWMDEETRMKALQKANTITSHIGFPKQLLNDTEIAHFYHNLAECSSDNYFDNMLKLSKWMSDTAALDLNQPRLKADWRNFADAAVVNAYYSAVENAIIFPAGILQGLFFNYHNPDYVNFGAIGTVIAHEITHAFDDIGKQFDSYGNYKNWWHNQTDQRFKTKAQCLVDQYNNYILPENGMRLNSINTLGENIADNVGVREAFKAFTAYSRGRPEQRLLPGLNYTPEQLFWITFGNIWCTRVRPEMYNMILDKETHSPARFRVIGALSNIKEFAQSFNCAEGSAMNPKTKCNIW